MTKCQEGVTSQDTPVILDFDEKEGNLISVDFTFIKITVIRYRGMLSINCGQ